MKIKLFSHIFKNILLKSILAASFLFSNLQNSFAVTDQVRNASIDGAGRCVTKKLDFNPFNGPDVLWEIDNPVCIGYIVGSGVALKSASMVSGSLCSPSPSVSKILSSFSSGVPIGIANTVGLASDWGICASMTISCIGTLGASCTPAASCCAAAGATTAVLGIAVGALGVIHKFAIDSQSDAHICGETWNTWEKRDATQSDSTDIEGIIGYQKGSLPEDKFYVYGKKAHSHSKSLEDKYKNGNLTANIDNKEYREFIYGGMEFEDNSDGACPNPTWSGVENSLGYNSGNQRYYMRGPKVVSNYACTRFLLHKGSLAEKNNAKAAYDCCIQRSKSTICIEESGGHEFCKIGERCKVKDVWYEIYSGKIEPNYICAKTYSVCPYNHNLGGGTEIANRDDDNQDILLNHCQYLKHCAKIPGSPYIRTSDLDGGWISSACFDLKGDSQNNYGYTADLLPVNTKNFSAPIAQCFKETMENIFVNKAGHTQCSSIDEKPDKNGNCESGYYYREGEVIAGQKSFFQNIQEHLQTAIKIVMTIAVTIMGIGVLLTGSPMDKKTLLMFITKLGLVAYFALGNAWQDTFFVNLSKISMDVAQIFMRVEAEPDPAKNDGCQFPKYNVHFKDGSSGSKYDSPAYRIGKEYLGIWDTLDCKIAVALGYSLNASVPNLIMMILGGLLTGGLGIIFFVATLIFAFYLIALTIRALHIFLMSAVSIVIMIYISPITITASLFKRTESIFKNWRTNLVSFILQPVILFAYLGILITIFDKVIIGDATFTGDGKNVPKQINCSSGNASNNSIYCIFRIADIKTNNSMAPIGVGLPVLFNMNEQKLFTIINAAFIMFILTKFLDQITALAQKLLGGSELQSDTPGSMDMLAKAYGVASAVQSRGTNAVAKWGGRAASGVSSNAKNIVRKLGERDGASGSSGVKTDSTSDSSKKNL